MQRVLEQKVLLLSALTLHNPYTATQQPTSASTAKKSGREAPYKAKKEGDEEVAVATAAVVMSEDPHNAMSKATGVDTVGGEDNKPATPTPSGKINRHVSHQCFLT
jgi:hypothetical protein